MKKNILLIIMFFCVIWLTGCGEKTKTCAKWETKSEPLEDCSGYDYYHKIYCEQKNSKKKETKTCVEWAE